MLDLQPYKQKEDGHEAVVDPVVEILRYLQVAESDGDGQVEQGGVEISPRRICPEDGDDGAGDEDDAAGAFYFCKAQEGAGPAGNGAMGDGNFSPAQQRPPLGFQ